MSTAFAMSPERQPTWPGAPVTVHNALAAGQPAIMLDKAAPFSPSPQPLPLGANYTSRSGTRPA